MPGGAIAEDLEHGWGRVPLEGCTVFALRGRATSYKVGRNYNFSMAFCPPFRMLPVVTVVPLIGPQ